MKLRDRFAVAGARIVRGLDWEFVVEKTPSGCVSPRQAGVQQDATIVATRTTRFTCLSMRIAPCVTVPADN
jgi:hypothetical protein